MYTYIYICIHTYIHIYIIPRFGGVLFARYATSGDAESFTGTNTFGTFPSFSSHISATIIVHLYTYGILALP